jgi:hypothetical protein
MTFGIKSIDHVCYSRKRVINMHWRMVDCHPVRPTKCAIKIIPVLTTTAFPDILSEQSINRSAVL